MVARVATDGAPTPPRVRLGADEPVAWRSYLRGHATVTRALEADLLAGPQLSRASYDVLVQLAEAPGRRLRMTEPADAVLLSRSGVTRLVAARLDPADLAELRRISERLS